MNLAYTVASPKSFDAVVRAIEEGVAAKGFRVLYIHDVQATLAEKGFAREPYKIVEVCNAKYASRALGTDPLIGVMMPCKINVYTVEGATRITLLLPSLLASFFPEAGLATMANEIETALRAVVAGAC